MNMFYDDEAKILMQIFYQFDEVEVDEIRINDDEAELDDLWNVSSSLYKNELLMSVYDVDEMIVGDLLQIELDLHFENIQ